MKALVLSLTAALMVFAQLTLAQSADQASIREVVERETNAYIKRDGKAIAAYWHFTPEMSHLYSIPDGTVIFLTDPDKAMAMIANEKPTKDTFQNSNYKTRVNSNAAFIQFDQELIQENGNKIYSHQNRYLEKINNNWKIVNAMAVYYVPGK
jgi:thymidylate kinase